LWTKQSNCRSSINSRNINGPSQEPWGIPPANWVQFEKTSLTFTRYWLPSRNENIHLTIKCGTLRCANLCNTILWSTRSNAFWKSVKTVRTDPPLSKAVAHKCSRLTTAWVVDRPLTLTAGGMTGKCSSGKRSDRSQLQQQTYYT